MYISLQIYISHFQYRRFHRYVRDFLHMYMLDIYVYVDIYKIKYLRKPI